MAGKRIEDLTDAELDALSADELEALQNSIDAPGDDEEEEEEMDESELRRQIL